MIEEKTLSLDIGRNYELVTVYGFKTGPHSAIYLGESNFRGLTGKFFRGIELGFNDIRYYYVLREPKISNKTDARTGLLEIRTNEKELEILATELTNEAEYQEEEFYEFVFNVDKHNRILDGYSSSKEEMRDGETKSELIKILREFEEIY